MCKSVPAVGLLLCAAQAAMAASPSVKEIAGNILLLQSDGNTRQLTTTGQDSMPSISLDGKRVVFVRSRTESSADDLCLIDLSKPFGQQLSTITPSEQSAKHEIAEILDPQFSPDASTVYFYTQPGNFGLIIGVNLVSDKSIVLAHSALPTARRAFDVIQRGKYAGDLIVYKDSEKLTAGRLFLYWLVSPRGENIAIIADKGDDLALFRNQIGLIPPN